MGRCLTGVYTPSGPSATMYPPKFHAKIKISRRGKHKKNLASASQRFRKNTITTFHFQGMDFHDHSHKASILKDYFSEIIGTTPPTHWNFGIRRFYPTPLPQLQDIDAPFGKDEIKMTFIQMNPIASPGSDGFGPPFTQNIGIS